MAVADHPNIRGFPIRVNHVESSCQGDNSVPASQIVGNLQNAGVLGNICSGGLESALPIYQTAGVVVISGSATRDTLPLLGPNVFSRTIVRDGDGGAAWYDAVSVLLGTSSGEPITRQSSAKRLGSSATRTSMRRRC